MLALVEVHIDIVSLSSATEGILLVLDASLLLNDLQFLCLENAPTFPPYSSVTKESPTYNFGIYERSCGLKYARCHFVYPAY